MSRATASGVAALRGRCGRAPARSSGGAWPPSSATQRRIASPAPLRSRVPSRSTPLMRVWAVNGTNSRVVRRELVLADPVLLGEHDDRAALGRLVGERGQLRRLGELAPRTTPGIGTNAAAWRLPSVIVPVLSSSSTSTSPDASTARPDSASTLRRTSRSMPAMPIADSSAPIVVGMSATSSAISVVIEIVGAGEVGERPQRDDDDEEDRASGRRAGCRARSRSASCAASAPSTSAIMRSRNDWPGSCVISTTIRSESTRVPPVTARRSPPASRMTGADSPVIADSSTDAMPSIDRAVAGDHLAGLDDDDVAAAQLGRGARRCRPRSVRDGRRCASRAASSACALPRPSAIASARLPKTTVSHSQTRDGEREPAPASSAAADASLRISDGRRTAPISTTNMTGLRDHVARVELAQRRRAPGAGSSG